MINRWDLDELIVRGLKEDINHRDLAAETLIEASQESEAVLVAKEDGVIAGLEVFKAVFRNVDPSVDITEKVEDGDFVTPGQEVLTLSGPTRSILTGERLALNFLQRMSGIASLSARYAQAVKGLPVRLVDTRKTTPTLRALEKYAVTVGGCHNHRYNLSDALMIKDNHIAAVGSIAKAVARGRERIPHTMTIEVEVKDLGELEEALIAQADIIMLDNMSTEMMREAVRIADGRAIIEASGGITLETVRDVAETGVDVISVGALTHSYSSLDLSLRIK